MIDGKRMRERRKELGMSLDNLKTESGVSKTYLSQLENGVNESPSYRIVAAIADALEVSFYYLTGETDNRSLDVCGNCRYFSNEVPALPINQSVADGVCKRYPANPYIDTDFYKKEWLRWTQPRVHLDDTCGEFQPIRRENNGRS